MHNVVFSLIHHINGAGATVHTDSMGVDLQLASRVLRQDSSSTKLEDTYNYVPYTLHIPFKFKNVSTQ